MFCDIVPTMNVIVVAAGSGRRLGGNLPKQYLLLNGKPILYYTLNVFERSPLVKNVSVVISHDAEKLYDNFLQKYGAGFSKLTCPFFGGKERRDSVYNAMSEIANHFIPDDNLIAVHDGVRPFLSEDLLKKVYETAEVFGGSAPALPLVDTVKEIDCDSFIVSNPIREKLKIVQTPQVFNFSQYLNAVRICQKKNIHVTDDTEIYSRFAEVGKVKLVAGDSRLFKITYKEDIERAEKILSEENEWKF